MATGSLEGFLVDRGLLTSSDLQKANRICTETGDRLLAAVRRLGIISGVELAQVVAAYYALPAVRESEWPETLILGEVLSARYLREQKLLPLAVDDRRLILAAADPGHMTAIDAIRLAADRSIEIKVAPAED